MRNLMAVLVVAVMTLGSGCGSVVMAMIAPGLPYGGVQADVEFTTYAVKHGSPVGAAVGLIDLAPSLALDTALLPVTLSVAAADGFKRTSSRGY